MKRLRVMQSNWSKKLVGMFAALAMVFALASTASAEALKAFATRSGNLTGTGATFISLTNGGATALNFSTPGANKVIKITYNAECSALGPSGWTSVEILVDGVAAEPNSGTLFAFCTQPVANATVWTGATRQSIITVPAAGNHSVQVRVNNNSGATQWWLGDSSLVVEQK